MTLILYGSELKLTKGHKLVTGHGRPDYFVRAEMVKENYTMALDKASPMEGETVLNTVPIIGRSCF